MVRWYLVCGACLLSCIPVFRGQRGYSHPSSYPSSFRTDPPHKPYKTTRTQHMTRYHRQTFAKFSEEGETAAGATAGAAPAAANAKAQPAAAAFAGALGAAGAAAAASRREEGGSGGGGGGLGLGGNHNRPKKRSRVRDASWWLECVVCMGDDILYIC